MLIEVGENSGDSSTARRLPARLNASEEIMPTAALEEAEGAAASNYGGGGIISEIVALVSRVMLNPGLSYPLLYSFRI